MKLRIIEIAGLILLALILLGLYYTSPQHKFAECHGDTQPRYCVD